MSYVLCISELLAAASGNLTPKTLTRCAQMSGAFGRYLDELFTESGLGEMSSQKRPEAEKVNRADVVSLVEDLIEEELFEFVPGRFHRGFEDISASGAFKEPSERYSPILMGLKLHRLAKAMDSYKELNIDALQAQFDQATQTEQQPTRVSARANKGQHKAKFE